jgi:predicted nucleic acid-binding protein
MDGLTRVYLDTNVFIAAFERKDALGLQIGRLFEIRRNSQTQSFVTSELTLSELLVAPFRNGDADLSGAYESLMTTNEWLQVIPVTKSVLKGAAWLRSLSISLKLPDAIHLATAMDARCTDVLTDDLALGKLQLPADIAIAVLRPDEPTLTELIERLSA